MIKEKLEERIREGKDIDEEFLRLCGVKLLGIFSP